VKEKSLDTDLHSRPMRLLMSSPDHDEDFVISASVAKQPAERNSRGRKKGLVRSGSMQLTTEMLAALPQDLVLVAQQPIVKGARFRSGGIAGNIRSVLRARRLIYQVLNGEADVPEDWRDDIDVQRSIVKLGRKMPALRCPECQGPI
jgi:hypothetical protein